MSTSARRTDGQWPASRRTGPRQAVLRLIWRYPKADVIVGGWCSEEGTLTALAFAAANNIMHDDPDWELDR